MSVFDAVIVGGGIIGASAANHLAAAGFSTVLLEQGDFAGATSGRSSRLQHCGLTYFSPGRSLANFLFHPKLAAHSIDHAARSMRERSAFVRATPERVRPLTFFAPLYKDGSIPVWKARLGLNLLEKLDPGGVSLDIRHIPPAEVRHHPALTHLRDAGDLYGVLSFTEYQFDWPERICLDTILHARDAGAVTRNYVRVDKVERTSDQLWTVTAVDLRTDLAFTVKARAFVNAAGAWIDHVARAGNLPTPRLNQGAKGTNIMVRLPEAFRGQGFETIMRDGDPFYVIPWDDLHYFGPMDAAVEPTAENFRTRDEEISHLLAEMNHLFPSLQLGRKDVLYTWSGVRPRTFDPQAPMGGMTSELHDFSRRGVPAYVTYSGGLIMTHRHAGRAITAAVGSQIQPSGASRPLTYAARPPITGPQDTDELPMAAIRHGATHEDARTLTDMLFRRVKTGWGERMGADTVDDVADGVRDIMGWSAAEARRQAGDYRDFLAREFNFPLANS